MKLSIILHQKQLFPWIRWFSFMLPIMFLMVLNESLVLWSYWSVSFLIFAPNIDDSNQENKKIKCCCFAWLWKYLLSLFWLTWIKQERTEVSKEQKFFILENNQSKACSSERLNLFNKYFDQITYFSHIFSYMKCTIIMEVDVLCTTHMIVNFFKLLNDDSYWLAGVMVDDVFNMLIKFLSFGCGWHISTRSTRIHS